MRPARSTSRLPVLTPCVLTMSVKSGARPSKRAPVSTAPATLTVPAASVTPSTALIRPSMRIAALDSGAVPLSSWPTAPASGWPLTKKRSAKLCVGVLTDSEPTFTTPPAPTTNPCGLAKNTLPPMRPSRIAFSVPWMSVRASRTIFTRFTAPLGTCRFAVCPELTLKVLNELKPELPAIVPVRMSVTAPAVLTVVSVRPSAWIACAHAAGDISSGRLAMPIASPCGRCRLATRVRSLGRLRRRCAVFMVWLPIAAATAPGGRS